MTACTKCGTPATSSAKFCENCGAQLPEAMAPQGAAPVASEPPAPVIPPPASEPNEPLFPRMNWTLLVRGNWVGAVAIALAAAFTAGLFGMALALLAKPTDFGVTNTLTLATAIAAGAFGADLVGHGSTTGLFSADASASVGLYPLTVTLTTLVVAVLLFGRLTRRYASLWGAFADAVRTAVFFGVFLWIPSMVFNTDNDKMGRGWGHQLDQKSLDAHLELGTNPGGALALGFLIMLLVLSLHLVMRSTRWSSQAPTSLPQRIYLTVRDWAGAPLAGLTVMALLLPLAGLAGLIAVALFGEDTGGQTNHEETRVVVAACIALLVNGGVWVLSIGSGAPFGSITDSSESARQEDWSRIWGDITDKEPGLWIAPIVLLAVLTLAALAVVRRSQPRFALRSLAVWVGSLVIFTPLLVRLSAFHAAGEAHDKHDHASGTLYGGPEGLQTTLLVVLIAAVVAFVVAVAAGALTRDRLRAAVATASYSERTSFE